MARKIHTRSGTGNRVTSSVCFPAAELLDLRRYPMRALILAFTLAWTGCAADFPVDGTWRGGTATDHFASYVMQLRQDGDRISGVVCRVSSLHRVFFDRPVSGRYPWMSFDTALDGDPVRVRVDLRIVGENRITGTDNNPRANIPPTNDLVRAPSVTYEECRNALH